MCDLDPKFKIRRNMAKSSMFGIGGVLVVMVIVIFLGTSEIRENMEVVTPVINMILGVLASLVAGYGVSVSYDDIDKRKYDDSSEDTDERP